MSRTPASLAAGLVITALFMCNNVKAATESSGSGTTEATVQTIEQLEHELNSAILGQDPAALDRLLSDDYTNGGNQVRTKSEQIDQILASYQPNAQTLDALSVKLYGDTAVVTGLANAEWVSPAGARTDSMRQVNIWVHGENGWQVVYTQSTLVGLYPLDGC